MIFLGIGTRKHFLGGPECSPTPSKPRQWFSFYRQNTVGKTKHKNDTKMCHFSPHGQRPSETVRESCLARPHLRSKQTLADGFANFINKQSEHRQFAVLLPPTLGRLIPPLPSMKFFHTAKNVSACQNTGEYQLAST